jgi:hypothetical protein
VTTGLTAHTSIRCPHYHSLLSMIKVLLQTVQYDSVLIIHTEIQPIFTSSAQSMASTVAENNTSVVQHTRWKRKYTFQTERIQPNFSTTLSKLLIKLCRNRLNPREHFPHFQRTTTQKHYKGSHFKQNGKGWCIKNLLQSLQFVLRYIRS